MRYGALGALLTSENFAAIDQIIAKLRASGDWTTGDQKCKDLMSVLTGPCESPTTRTRTAVSEPCDPPGKHAKSVCVKFGKLQLLLLYVHVGNQSGKDGSVEPAVSALLL